MPQFLLILESVGTTELLLIGVVALMLLGPRRMPEMAKKLAKIMAEFRGTANEFKETWQKEIDLEQEAKALDINSLDDEPIARKQPSKAKNAELSAPDVKQLDPAEFEAMAAKAVADQAEKDVVHNEDANNENASGGKENWL